MCLAQNGKFNVEHCVLFISCAKSPPLSRTEMLTAQLGRFWDSACLCLSTWGHLLLSFFKKKQGNSYGLSQNHKSIYCYVLICVCVCVCLQILMKLANLIHWSTTDYCLESYWFKMAFTTNWLPPKNTKVALRQSVLQTLNSNLMF